MILTALAFLLQPPPAPAPETEEGRAAACAQAVRQDARAGLSFAQQWTAGGGGLMARQCLGLAYVALENWSGAASVFEQAAQEADRAQDARGADLWAQAGNAWLAADDTARALTALDTALRRPGLTPELRGEVHLDRARAFVGAGNAAGARAELDQALTLVPRDPMASYLSAALALRQGDLARARTDIARARELAADSPDILLLAGTIAGRAGDMAEAERIYRQVAQAAPDSEAGRAAAASLATLREVEVPASPPAPAQPEPPSPQRR
jgi:tetratricopeptide (TPR) repeat protein